MADELIELKNVRTHNLKNIHVSFPINQLTVVTGVSGSGKSSLVFDTIYAEAYHRYLNSLSSFARQYLQSLPKPKIEYVKNLPPAIAVRQSHGQSTNRSTVGTLSEVIDLLRELICQDPEYICPNGHGRISCVESAQAFQILIKNYLGKKAIIAAPLSRWENLGRKAVLKELQAQGFSRLWHDGGIVEIQDSINFSLNDTDALVDRLILDQKSKSRILNSLQIAQKLGRGVVHVYIRDSEINEDLVYSNQLQCPKCEAVFFKPTAARFSFNHPLGACESCQGFGMTAEIDWRKVIPDQEKSLSQKAVEAWNFGEHVAWYQVVAKSQFGTKLYKKPIKDFTPDQLIWLKEGGKGFSGIKGYFQYLDRKRYKAHYRIHASRFRRYVTCQNCSGNRLKPQTQFVRWQGMSIQEMSNLSISKLSDKIASLDGYRNETVEELTKRFNYLKRMGLGYLSLGRSARTLSGGELQRLQLARCLGITLTDTLYCLDEPTSGLHAQDGQNLIGVMRELVAQGNTLIAVEHDSAVMRSSDYQVVIGPRAGIAGGEVVYQGKPKELGLPFSFAKERPYKKHIVISNAKTNNLKCVSVKIPISALTTVCGVSGSGKTSLIQHTLFPLLKLAHQAATTQKSFSEAEIAAELTIEGGVQQFSDVLMVSQLPMGKSSRSNIATYLGIFDFIRSLFASQQIAKDKGLKPGSFSFNTPGGRCENCKGLGTVIEELSFLGEMEVTCTECQGQRFNNEVLSVTVKGKSLIDVLEMSVDEVRQYLYDQPRIVKILDPIINLGLGYLRLGQATSSFSGGEAQRLKLLALLTQTSKLDPAVLIFDEPTTGLSDSDIQLLIKQFQGLVEMGHTIIVVEHHIGMIKSSDWLIEIGPGSADFGGELVFSGAPRNLKSQKKSATAPFLID